MNDRTAASRIAAAQMSDALARWERDGGALARAARRYRDDPPGTTVAEAVFSDVAIQQGMILERRHDKGAAHYRLVPQGKTLALLVDAGDFKLTLGDVETILMNRNPA